MGDICFYWVDSRYRREQDDNGIKTLIGRCKYVLSLYVEAPSTLNANDTTVCVSFSWHTTLYTCQQ